jgi:hypothetical protein
MSRPVSLPLLLVVTTLLIEPLSAEEVPRFVAQRSAVQVLAASADTPDSPYLAFPAVLDLGDEVLVSYKHGRSHARDLGATLDWLRLDKAGSRTLAQGTLAEVPGEIMQMGEWARFPNGDIANYIDAQNQGVLRSGLRAVRSTDGGRSFGPVQRVGAVDGVEYGYAFDAITRGETTWMMVMTFTNLSGGKPVYQTSSQPGSVDVIRSDDNGRSWHFVRSITQELGGAPINESAFVADGEGFIVTARGYDGRHWLLRTDAQFQRLAQIEWNAAYSFIHSHLGRPRLFERDGAWYLLGRNPIRGTATQLALFRFHPDTLAISRYVVLDTTDGQPAGDSYYAQPFWQDREGSTRFQVITYKQQQGPGPDIVRLEFDWTEVR